MTAAVCRLVGSALVIEMVEYPLCRHRTRHSQEPGLDWSRARSTEWSTAIVISTCLERYAKEHLRRAAQVIRVPIRGGRAGIRPGIRGAGPFHPGLCGETSTIREKSTLCSMHLPRSRRSRGGLLVIGGSSDRERWTASGAAPREPDLGGASGVHLGGVRSGSALPGRSERHHCVRTAQGSGLFSTARSPTKLGEYLATARPVVVTATGDAPSTRVMA